MSLLKNSNCSCQSGCASANFCQTGSKAAFCSGLGLFGDWFGFVRTVSTFGASGLPTRSAVTSSWADCAPTARPARIVDARNPIRSDLRMMSALPIAAQRLLASPSLGT